MGTRIFRFRLMLCFIALVTVRYDYDSDSDAAQPRARATPTVGRRRRRNHSRRLTLVFTLRHTQLEKYICPSVVSVLLFKVYLVNVGDYMFY